MKVEQQAGQLLIKLANCIDGPEKHAAIVQALAVVVAKERERCAEVADLKALEYDDLKEYPHDEQEFAWQTARATAVEISAAIRKGVKP